MMKKEYPRPSLTADIVIISSGKVLLIQRGREPYKGCWALPGGFAEPGETIEQTAQREAYEETGLKDLELEELGLFSKPGRDPRGWVVSDAFLARADNAKQRPEAGDDADLAIWFDIEDIGNKVLLKRPKALIVISYERQGRLFKTKYESEQHLAFDHDQILLRALNR
jgi:8-oxo-dGTP diphosphatase